MILRPLSTTLFPYTTLFRSRPGNGMGEIRRATATIMNDSAKAPKKYVCSSVISSATAGRAMARLTRKTIKRRSEEHTSELQSLAYLVCRLLLEKKKKQKL